MDSDSGNSEHFSEGEENTGLSNAGWADSIARILHSKKPKGKKALVLSKAKKLTDVRKEKPQPAGFQVATEEGAVKDVEIEQEESSKEPPQKKRKELPAFRVKPNILDKDRERTLSKIATRGVVQLFNAVRLQQKDISNKLKEAGPLEVRKEKVLKNIDKRAFLDVLMGGKGVSESVPENEISVKKNTESDSKTTWSVLRDDFMMEAKLKDWDKELEESENEQEQDIEQEIESE